MSENGVHSSVRTWKVGFYNCDSKKYLTAEKFGYQVNVTGTALKKLQVWTIEQDTKTQLVYIRSHLGKYLTAEKNNGKVNVDDNNDDRPDGETDGHGFIVEYSSDGKWAFKHKRLNYYLGEADTKIICYNKTAGSKEFWSIQLFVHPQINLYNVQRQSYAHLNKDDGKMECTEKLPWGADALIMLDFTSGKYSLKTCDNRYLSFTGDLLDELDDSARFNLELHSGCLAFKDSAGHYLLAVGQTGVMKTKAKSSVKDELFTLSDSHPQVQIISENGSGKSVSTKQGLDVSANQSPKSDEIEDTEIFQMEFHKDSQTWAFVTNKSKYWTLVGEPPNMQIASSKSKKSQFIVEYQEDGSVKFKGDDGNYIANKGTGVMHSNEKDEANVFVMNIVNRPLLVLKGEHGFVGLINKGTQCVCNTPSYDTFEVTCNGKGVYTLKAANGQYLSLDDSKTLVLDTVGADFQFQFNGASQLAIKEKGGNFLKGDQNGIMKATATEIASNCLWEF